MKKFFLPVLIISAAVLLIFSYIKIMNPGLIVYYFFPQKIEKKEIGRNIASQPMHIKKVYSIAEIALNQTLSTLPTSQPKVPNWTDRGDDIRVDEFYQKELIIYIGRVKNDREILVSALNEIIKTGKEKNIVKEASSALKNIKVKDITEFKADNENHKLITEDHNNLRKALEIIISTIH